MMLKKLLLFISISYVLGISAIWIDGLLTGYSKSEVAIVLGNQVYPSGEPSERLKARLNRAKKLYTSGIVERIIVSGGFGKEGHDEAIVMKQYLEKYNIPSVDIIVDSKGDNTRLTAKNIQQWVDQSTSIIVVSQLYHVSRVKMAFQQQGYQQVGIAYANFYEWRDIYASLRELPAWLSYRLNIK